MVPLIMTHVKWSEVWLGFKHRNHSLIIRVEVSIPSGVPIPKGYRKSRQKDRRGFWIYFSRWYSDIHDAEDEAINLTRWLSYNKQKTMFLRELRRCVD